MKKIVILTLILILFSIPRVSALQCCKDPATDQWKCYPDPPAYYKCGDYCYPYPCYDFRIWVSGPNVFRVGQKTPVSVYIENVGYYTDSYDIEAESSNPSLILVDMTSASEINDVAPGQTKRIHPRITVLSSTTTGNVVFNATSRGNSTVQRNATLSILESDYYLSLPEFNSLFLIAIIILTGFVYTLGDRGEDH